ncbi:hypothetical protein EAKF1_ch3996c [Escherichia albertii KF1]|nr:hypothetical protein EAKF1_ch3996c [Escherichia albertii KF1]
MNESKLLADIQLYNCLMRFAYQADKNINILNLGNICRLDKAFTPHPA